MNIESGITAKMVMLKLADNANDEGNCYPSVRYLAAACQMTENGIRNQIKKLTAEGLVDVEIGGGRKANNYTLFPVKPEQLPLHAVDPSIELTPARREGHPCTPLTPPLHGMQGTPAKLVDPNHNLTVIEPTLNHQPKQKAAAAAPTSDEDWLRSLESDPTYAGIDVRREHGKLLRWCETNRKQATRRRFVNWLNRSDRPMGATRTSSPTPPQDPKDTRWL